MGSAQSINRQVNGRQGTPPLTLRQKMHAAAIVGFIAIGAACIGVAEGNFKGSTPREAVIKEILQGYQYLDFECDGEMHSDYRTGRSAKPPDVRIPLSGSTAPAYCAEDQWIAKKPQYEYEANVQFAEGGRLHYVTFRSDKKEEVGNTVTVHVTKKGEVRGSETHTPTWLPLIIVGAICILLSVVVFFLLFRKPAQVTDKPMV